ncbi:unnamed protein product [Acanthoscelides obtectus]|uniref:Reverse transcriptase domain-containing protein n=1 Tax=Acanthoscelides obtectus TaxID=200917 RepID=A0A9P0M8U7_ACAOB|nr:unnamed protein product [Acanthoscelides obtectus]CAK1671830.1 hypothetical protein AOBTE_LOCUS28486 [Acanthoscelides obtectus]
MLLIYGECLQNDTESSRVYADRFPRRHHPRPRRFVYLEELLNRVDENPSTTLQPDDFPARVRFCEWLLHQHDNNPDFLKCILVTDESTFTRNGVNNFRFQAETCFFSDADASAVCSLITEIIHRLHVRGAELLYYLKHHDLISDRQCDFQDQRSTGDLLAYSYGDAHVVALDITKASDQLWHAALLRELPSYDLPEKLCRGISVVIDGSSSSSHNVNAGFPQGSGDKPISAAELEKRRLATTSSLTRDLEVITAWGRNNLVQFNASKTQYCTLTNKRYFSPHVSLTLYKAQIRPSLEYCSHVWGAAAPTTLFRLDAVHRRAVRLIDDCSLTDTLFYRYTNELCSSELSSMMSQLLFPSSTNLRQFKNRIN